MNTKNNLYEFKFTDSHGQESFFFHLCEIASESDEGLIKSIYQSLTERERFTEEDLAWMKGTKIQDVVVPEGDNNVSMILLNKTGEEMKVSARPATRGEFRAEVFRKFIADAKLTEQSTKSVYQGIVDYLKQLKDNPSYRYLQVPYAHEFLESIGAEAFDHETEFYRNLRDHVSKCLLRIGTLYTENLDRDPSSIIKQVNGEEDMQLPEILINILNANKALEQNLINMNQQLDSEQPFKKDSEEYRALTAFHCKLRTAQRIFLGSNLSQSDIHQFNTTFANAITDVKNSDLVTTPYWSAPQDGLKNKLGCLETVCNLFHLLNANKALEKNLKKMEQQLDSEQPFKKGSEEYRALTAFHCQLQEARTTVLSSNLSKDDINTFKQACAGAVQVAEKSSLSHHLGWWGETIKPILTCIAILLTLFTALAIPAVRGSVRNAFCKPAINSFKDAKMIMEEYKASSDCQETGNDEVDRKSTGPRR